jgi:hypothetical protein
MKDKGNFGKSTTFKVFDFLAGAGASLIPGASIPYEGLKKIIEIAKDYRHHKAEQKIHQFHISILNGVNTEEFLNKEWNIDDYISLLNCCLQDIEEEKSEIYGKLLKGLINDATLQRETRKRMVLLIKELSINDILLLKKFYIYSYYRINDRNNIDNIKSLFTSKKYEDKISKNKLAYLSLIDFDNDYVDEFIKLFLETIFEKKELTPENIGLKEWNNIKICIISYKLNDPLHAEIATEVEQLYYQKRISSVICALIREGQLIIRHMYNISILILDDQDINGEYIKLLNQFSEKRPLFILNIGKRDNKCIQQIEYKNIFKLNYPNNLQQILFEILDIYSKDKNVP